MKQKLISKVLYVVLEGVDFVWFYSNTFFSQLKSDSSNNEVRSQLELTEKLIQTAAEAKVSYANQDYTKTIELLSTIIDVRILSYLY